jgi:uncharacterized protein (DUF1015 family)
MALVAPFRALRYDPARVQPAQVVTQPYDKITPKMQDGYYAASPYNLVRIILGKPEPSDNEQHNVYTRAGAYLQSWRREGVFLQDAEPSLYSYTQTFTPPGSTARDERRGFIALGRIKDYSAGVVHRHEQTLSKPKADRLNLLRATRAHFGQIFMLYSDSGEIDSLLASQAKPDLEIEDEYAVVHRVGRVSDPEVINAVRTKMRDQRLIIADGHHRYETALNYRNERRAAAGFVPSAASGGRTATATAPVASTELAPYDLVMMTFVNMNSPGLLVLPTHRVVHGLSEFSASKFAEGARKYFNLEEVDCPVDAARATKILQHASHAGTALLATTASKCFLLHTPKANGSNVFGNLSLRQQSLDVVQLHKALLEGVLGLSEESIRNQENISYLRDAGEAIARVREGSANVAFLMNPCRIEQIRDIAFAGEVMPQKSTDFYPKLLTGLTAYALD